MEQLIVRQDFGVKEVAVKKGEVTDFPSRSRGNNMALQSKGKQDKLKNVD